LNYEIRSPGVERSAMAFNSVLKSEQRLELSAKMRYNDLVWPCSVHGCSVSGTAPDRDADAGKASKKMDVMKMLAELREERAQIEEAILTLERLARGQGRRRGRPPQWLVEARKRADDAAVPMPAPIMAKPARGRPPKVAIAE
jgi:hypothetical protein